MDSRQAREYRAHARSAVPSCPDPVPPEQYSRAGAIPSCSARPLSPIPWTGCDPDRPGSGYQEPFGELVTRQGALLLGHPDQAVVLAARVDGVLLVAAAGISTARAVTRSLELLGGSTPLW